MTRLPSPVLAGSSASYTHLATGQGVDMADKDHVYLSTACLHGIHEHCQARANLEGEPKTPATCKWCGSPCICDCHQPVRRS